MSNFSDQIEEIKTLISSSTDKSLAYSTLLFLQEQSGNDPGPIQTLAEASPSLVSVIVADIHDQDEEIAVQALKCLGFTVYHKSLVAVISVEAVNLVLDSLVKLITTTKIKSVCNLGAWCISVQQFSEPILASHFNPLLRALVHGLDNPFGSLSTTFEASQAVMRLAGQLGEKMRNSSHVWAPPLYRRLLSLDKRERDMSERCLLKTRALLLPPPLNLSKALNKDMRHTLLAGMKNLTNSGMKIQAIRAWGWFIKLLGSYALKNRNLVNDMLKIPEHTFLDHDSQLQIASLVAWEGLIDALIDPAMLPQKRNVFIENEQLGTPNRENYEVKGNGFSKSVKLIMRPLVGIVLGKCEASVHGSCFSTWCYLLHKLDFAISCLSVKELVLQPMFEAIFQKYSDGKSIWLWERTIDLLDDSILVNSQDVDKDSSDSRCHCSSSTTPCDGDSSSQKCLWKQYPIKWLPWESNQLEFHFKFVHDVINQKSKTGLTDGEKRFVTDAALRLFRSISKGVQMILRKSSTTYDDILLCLDAILKFIKNLWEKNSERSNRDNWCDISLQLIHVIIEEIEPTILGSPLYKRALDLKHIESQTDALKFGNTEIVEICSINYMDMVSPIVYLTVLYFCIMAQSNFNTSNSDDFQKAAQKYCKFMLSSYDPLDTFIITVSLLYKHIGLSCLRLWTVMVKDLVDCTEDEKSVFLFKSGSAYFATRDMLCYPFIVCYYQQKNLMSVKVSGALEDGHVSRQINHEFEQVVRLWDALYGSYCSSKHQSLTANNNSEDLCNILDGWLDKYSKIHESTDKLELSHEDWNLDHISVYGGIVISILEKSYCSYSSQIENNGNGCGRKIVTGISNCLTLTIRFMRLLHTRRGKDLPEDFGLASRLYTALAQFISCLHLKKQDTHSFLEIIYSPLLQWLTQIEAQDKSANHQFQLVWKETLDCLRRSQPPLVFDSTFLELQSPLLEKTLDHPNTAISLPTVSFWNSTYGNQLKLDYPRNLLHVLDKLSRNGRITLHKRTTSSLLMKCDSGSRANAASDENQAALTHERSPKRTALLKGAISHPSLKVMPCINMKRKRLELTEHQKEVRRAQRGRERDCGGHGLGGIKTYTNLDFSQGNEDSQESQEMFHLESTLAKFTNDA